SSSSRGRLSLRCKEQGPVLCGEEESGCDRVDAQAITIGLSCRRGEPSCEAVDSRLGRRVTGYPRYCPLSCHRRNVDDAAAEFLRFSIGNSGAEDLRRQERAHEVELDDLFESGVGQLEKRPAFREGRRWDIATSCVHE